MATKKNQPVPPKKSNNFFRSALNQVNPLNPNNFIYDKAGGLINKAVNIAPQAYAQWGAKNLPGINSNKSILGMTTAGTISNIAGANLFANANKIAQDKGFGALKDLGYLGNVAGGVATLGSNLTPSVAGAAAIKAAKAAKAAGGSFTNVAKTAAKTFIKQPKAAAAFVALNTPSMVVGNNNSPEAIANRNKQWKDWVEGNRIIPSLSKDAKTPATSPTTPPKTELPRTSTVPPVKRVPLPGTMPPRPAPPKEYVPMTYAPSTPTPSTYVAPSPTPERRSGFPIVQKDENTSSSIMANAGNTVDTTMTSPTSTPTPFNRGTLPPDYQALAAQRDANQAALAEQTRLGLLSNADTLATSNLQTQGQFADVIGGRADSLYGMASTGNRRDFQLAQNATLAANQAGVNTLQNNYAEAMNQAQLNYQNKLLEEASKKAALAAQIRNIG